MSRDSPGAVAITSMQLVAPLLSILYGAVPQHATADAGSSAAGGAVGDAVGDAEGNALRETRDDPERQRLSAEPISRADPERQRLAGHTLAALSAHPSSRAVLVAQAPGRTIHAHTYST